MAFERNKSSQRIDRSLGKPFAASVSPWVPSSPRQNDLTEIRKKAKSVQRKQTSFTRDEMQELLAQLVMQNE